MSYTAIATAAPVNLSHDLLRRNNLLWLEKQVVALSAEYQALKATDDPRAAEVRAQGIARRAQLDRAARAERMGAE